VGEELGIPVYLYEQAATRPERKNLENLRRGQYEGLKSEIETHPARLPDFGPTHLGTAGATVIGARLPLGAFTVYLTSEDVAIANKVAAAVRSSSGGLRYVKALGLLVDGRAQVSMNLVDYRHTPLARVVEFIRPAQRWVSIHHSELVGLIPQDALVDAAVWYTQLDQFEPDQILERRLQQALQPEPSRPVEPASPAKATFLDSLAAGTATPGGGSAAAYSGAAAAALVAMVARLTLGRKRYLPVEEQMQSILERAEDLREDLTAAVDKDAAAYQAVLAALQLPKGSLEGEQIRLQAIEAATLAAAEVPLDVARSAVEVMELVLQVVANGNRNALSDAGTAGALAHAALVSAGYNVRTNLAVLEEDDTVRLLLNELDEVEERAAALEEQIQSEMRAHQGVMLK
jgi:glutamate formiminotransferase/formiminotetrahydrofolate cyclodeaminase